MKKARNFVDHISYCYQAISPERGGGTSSTSSTSSSNSNRNRFKKGSRAVNVRESNGSLVLNRPATTYFQRMSGQQDDSLRDHIDSFDCEQISQLLTPESRQFSEETHLAEAFTPPR